MRRAVPMFVFVVALLASARAYWAWTSVAIGSSTDYNFYYTSLAFSPEGYPATAYVGPLSREALNFAFYNGPTQTWKTQVVASRLPSGDQGCSLAFNPVTGRPAIAYGGSDLRLAQWDGTAWRTQVVDPTRANNARLSLAFFVRVVNNQRYAYPSIAYRAYVGGKGAKETVWLRYAWFDGAAWHIESVDAPFAGNWTWLAYQPEGQGGNPAIAYSTGWSGATYPLSTLKFAVRDQNTGTWLKEVVKTDSSAGRSVTFAFDSAGAPAIVDQPGDSQNRYLRFLRKEGGAWVDSQILGPPETGWDAMLRFDPGGQALVSYLYGGNAYKVMIARLVDGVWMHEAAVESQERVMAYDKPSFALDNSGLPALVYRSHPFGGGPWTLSFTQGSK
jgi:hypothetical protein